MVGMIKIFFFITVLMEDWKLVTKGIPVNYGLQKDKGISHTLGVQQKQKLYQNNCWPPDTTEALALAEPLPKKAKLGRP